MQTDDHIALPPLWCPLELRVREGEKVFQERSRAWLERHGLDERSLRRAAATDTGFLACVWAPDGSEEGVQLLADWLVWALLFDDYYCDTGPHSVRPGTFNPLTARMMARALYPATARTGDPAFDAFASALADMIRRIDALADPQLAQLCALAHYQWAVGAMCGVSDRAAGSLRSVEDHVLIRPGDGADILSVHMIEVAEGTVLPARDRIRPEVRAVTQAAGILLTVPTDLASYAHEHHQGCLESNLVHLVAARRGCPAQDAVDQACALLECVMTFFVTMRDRLREHGSESMLRYTDQLAHLVRGTYEWQRFLPRYTTVLDVPRHGGAEDPALRPADPARRPAHALHDIAPDRRHPGAGLPAPLAWWWELLDRPA
ncbi:hypothetical protein NX801_08880 [Streptomyces sp. LP05-1]|uniref:Terpene synthase n=1 Tax=Streptomyces pyxinae TaxID=2970734 RepID=A0ABT2CGE8_9ACTN|nr:hypothetical protein [Streptomyces sp. LP05-1]MCS0635776.1 hypothetical protein [Streptomyces sp. LP05-1]